MNVDDMSNVRLEHVLVFTMLLFLFVSIVGSFVWPMRLAACLMFAVWRYRIKVAAYKQSMQVSTEGED